MAVRRLVQLEGLFVGHGVDGVPDPKEGPDVLVAEPEGPVDLADFLPAGKRWVRIREGLLVHEKHRLGLRRSVPPADGIRPADSAEDFAKRAFLASPEHVDEHVDGEPLLAITRAPASHKGVSLEDADVEPLVREKRSEGGAADTGAKNEHIRYAIHDWAPPAKAAPRVLLPPGRFR